MNIATQLISFKKLVYDISGFISLMGHKFWSLKRQLYMRHIIFFIVKNIGFFFAIKRERERERERESGRTGKR